MGKFIPPKCTTEQREAHVLDNGELVFDTDLKKYFYGDGITVGGLEVGAGAAAYDGDPTIIVQDSTHQFVSSAQKSKLDGIADGATANDSDANLKNRANHTGTQAATTITEDSSHRFTTDSEKATWNSKETGGAAATAQAAAESYADALITALKASVPTEGDTLNKLYNLIINAFTEVTVADIAARDAYNVTSLPLHIFVTNDGDGNWALYKALTTGTGASFAKISDPDLLNAAMTASQIKTAYESNANTNAFTDALLSKLNGIASGATVNSSDASLRDRGTHTGTQLAATISDFATAVNLLIAAAGVPTEASIRRTSALLTT